MTYFEILDKTDSEIINLYLDYVNNFLTVRGFAEHYGIEEMDAHYIIDLGRNLNNNLATNKN